MIFELYSGNSEDYVDFQILLRQTSVTLKSQHVISSPLHQSCIPLFNPDSHVHITVYVLLPTKFYVPCSDFDFSSFFLSISHL